MALWSREKEQKRTHTNAPQHWPVVTLEQFDNAAINVLVIGAQLAEFTKPRDGKIAFMRDFLYEDGILQVPLVVEEDDARTCVFVYSDGDKDAAAHFSGVRALLRSRENATAVYYGPQALAPTKSAEVLRPIDTPLFSRREQPQNARFALWWATPEDPLFSQSRDRELLDRWFDALNGYFFLVFSAFVNDLDLVQQKQKVHALPGQPFLEALRAPGDLEVLLHASAPEGVFLAFDQDRTSAASRHLLLGLLADFAVKYRAAIEANKVPPRAEEQGLAAWRAVRDEALAKEAAGGTDVALHTISIRDGQPCRHPGARTSEERAAQPQMVGREDLDFAMDLIERTVAKRKTRAVEQSSQQQVGRPNLFPIIAVKANGHVWERELPYEDAQEALAVAQRALDDWPDAEIVAVLFDAAIRENGVRTDIFNVRLENRVAGAAADLMQRYKASASGTLEFAGRPTAMPIDRFLLPPTPDPRVPVDSGLTAFTLQALDEIIQMMTIVEPSGLHGDDPSAVLTGPSALVNLGEEQPHVFHFALQGPLTAAATCVKSIEGKPVQWIVFFIDDLVTKDGTPDRRLRLCVQRRGDAGAAVFEQRYEPPVKGKRFAPCGDLAFKRWGGSFLPR